MKLQRKIRVLMCCLAVMGMFSTSVLPSKAAQCTHTRFIVGYDALNDSYYTASGHYEVRGTAYQCPNCNYTYWEDLYTVKTGEHVYFQTGTDAHGYPIFSDSCAYCPYSRNQ